MKKYFPILVSKKGEIVALQHLEQKVKEEITPVIQVLGLNLEKKVKGQPVYNNFLENFFIRHWSFFGNQLILDFTYLENWDYYFDGIKRLTEELIYNNVNVVLSVNNNSPKIYSDLVIDLTQTYNLNICFKLSGRIAGFNDLNHDIEFFLRKFKTKEENVIIHLDYGDIIEDDFPRISINTTSAIDLLKLEEVSYHDIFVSSSSFPSNLGNIALSPPVQKLERLEEKLWSAIKKHNFSDKVKYSDYGTKSAKYERINFPGTVSLKYSFKDEFVFYRGELTQNHRLGHRQFIVHCKNLIDDNLFYGRDFSWGDLNYYKYSRLDENNPDNKTGNATTWVQISQNHHITMIHNNL
ncbi:beta family protein [Tenacibaculum ascidiaceicola]|uniref:beta family protein n=1 Tax=Tenacibaculum ascidiaceicola TaxID=1699411 RepID=UPI003893569F